MEKKGKPKDDIIDLKTKLKMLDTTTKIIVNGHEVVVSHYMDDPKKYNELPMTEEYKQLILKQCEESKRVKDILKCNPSFVDGYKERN